MGNPFPDPTIARVACESQQSVSSLPAEQSAVIKHTCNMNMDESLAFGRLAQTKDNIIYHGTTPLLALYNPALL